MMIFEWNSRRTERLRRVTLCADWSDKIAAEPIYAEKIFYRSSLSSIRTTFYISNIKFKVCTYVVVQ